MQVQIKFTAGGSSAIFGNFAPGDTLRCDAAAAKHFVEEARCAVYASGQAPKAADFADTQPADPPAADAAQAPAPKARARRTATD
jgi:hypothetical protein